MVLAYLLYAPFLASLAPCTTRFLRLYPDFLSSLLCIPGSFKPGFHRQLSFGPFGSHKVICSSLPSKAIILRVTLYLVFCASKIVITLLRRILVRYLLPFLFLSLALYSFQGAIVSSDTRDRIPETIFLHCFAALLKFLSLLSSLLSLLLLVEIMRFELMTPCLQGRCSPN